VQKERGTVKQSDLHGRAAIGAIKDTLDGFK